MKTRVKDARRLPASLSAQQRKQLGALPKDLQKRIRALPGKQPRLVLEYLRDRCITKAAIRAGYSPRSAKQTGFEILRQPEVADLVQATEDELMQRLEVTAWEVLDEMAYVAMAPMDEERPPGLDWRVKCFALDRMMRHFGLLVDRHELSGPGGGPIPVDAGQLRQQLADRLAKLAAVAGGNGNGAGK